MFLSPAHDYKINVTLAVEFPVYPVVRNELQWKQAGAGYQCCCYSFCTSLFKIINRLLIFFFFLGATDISGRKNIASRVVFF